MSRNNPKPVASANRANPAYKLHIKCGEVMIGKAS